MGSLKEAVDIEDEIMLCYCCLLKVCDCTIYECDGCKHCSRCCECDDEE